MAQYDKLTRTYNPNRRSDKNRFDYNRDIEVPALIKMIGDVKGKTILDLGCGFGDHAQRLSKKGFKKLVGVDLSKEMVKFANEKNIPNCEFYVGDMSKKLKHKDNSFDIVYSSLAIHYIDNLNNLFKEVNRVLKKNGVFIFSTGHPIFNLLNQSDKLEISITKLKNGKRKAVGNYFDESFRLNDLGTMGKVKVCNYTFETLIKSGLENNFELIDYKDVKPVKGSEKYDKEKFKLTNTLPTFILFKFRKK